MKKAFTLVELLVVIAIIGMLSAILMITMGRGTESSNNAKCISNMANLAKAVTANGQQYYPFAGSIERKVLNSSSGSSATFYYKEEPGWISWYSNGAYGKSNRAQGHLSSASWFVSAYADAPGGAISDSVSEMRQYCITNAALKSTFERSRDLLVCPQHKSDMRSKGLDPFFSYVMNSYFKWDDSEGSKAKSEYFNAVRTNLQRADKILLFAELPWKGWAGNSPNFTTSPGTECDCTLQYKDGEGIGFNHKKGKDKVAHVAFADGHTETLKLPKEGMSQSDLEELTTWLCEGKDISFEGGRQYKVME